MIALRPCAALAASGRIAVVGDTAKNPALAEALLRIRGELIAEGFEVIVKQPPNNREATNLGEIGEGAGALAAIGLDYDAGTREVELRVVDRLTNKTLVRRAPFGGAQSANASEVLAVRAVDLLRASLLELLAPPRAAPPKVAPNLTEQQAQASSFAQRALPSESSQTFCVEAGAGMLTSLSGIGPAVVPVVRARRVLIKSLSLRVGLAGLGSEPRVTTARASARVGQALGELDALAMLWSTSELRLSGSLGVGVLRTSVDGRAEWPYQSRQDTLWSAIVDLGAGLDLRLSSRLDLVFETHALLARPHPVIRFINDERAQGGTPSLFETFTLAGWL